MGLQQFIQSLVLLDMRLRVSMRLFRFHVVSMTFVMLNIFLWPDCCIGHRSQSNDCYDDHGDKHHHEYHFLGPYKDLVTPMIKIADTITPQPKMIAELGSLKKSISPIFFLSCFNYSESTQNRGNPKCYIDTIKFSIWTIHKEEQVN